jgi:sulfoquinovosyltransferase
MWALIRFWTRTADVMLVTSSVMATELAKHACRGSTIALWRRGVDVDIFSPAFRSAEARATLSAGNPDAPLLVYVGRLGAEKNLTILKGKGCGYASPCAALHSLQRMSAHACCAADVLAANPGSRLALVGDGPARASLEAHFAVRCAR